ncbi:hypothetical protein F4V43_01770 [Paenibacillus spiritus]|uniref:Uncharacterized protein n=1 Tax=Paenibacillus spiritus TaxID=2496557 RepID=A0A5J5GG98_9BACL|nr:hypothetical protein [Paenibacillus spiritus]KAA9007239.1 hypothetical protein F4V43_01770 [Paenibacillus spiritus]
MTTILKNKETGLYGTLEHSLFGGSIRWYDENTGAFCKSYGEKFDQILESWVIVPLPMGYQVGNWGGVVKIECGLTLI